MKDVPGVTLNEKSAKIPGILDEKKKLESDLKSTKASLASQTEKAKDFEKKFKAADAENVRLNQDKVKLSNDLRKTKIALEDAQKESAKKDVMVEQLKKELVAAKSVQVDNTELDNLKQENTLLKNQIGQLKKDYEAAAEKARILDLAEVVTYEDIDLEAGKKKITKKYIVPYLGEGEQAVVTNVSQKDNLLTVNKGKKDQLAEGQNIDLALKGVLIANSRVLAVGDDYAVLRFSPKKGFPETIEEQDVLELVKVIKLEEPKAEEAAKPAAEEAKPAAKKAEAEEEEEEEAEE